MPIFHFFIYNFFFNIIILKKILIELIIKDLNFPKIYQFNMTILIKNNIFMSDI